MRTVPFLLALTLVALPAVAQDDPKPSTEGDTPPAAAKEADAPAERRTSEPAEALLRAYGKKMHLPADLGAEKVELTASSAAHDLLMGQKVDLITTWDAKAGLRLAVSMPAEAKEMYPAETVAMVENMVGKWAREILAPVFESPAKYVADYHVDASKPDEPISVALEAFEEEAAAESQTMYFDGDGLCDRRVSMWRIGPDDPMEMQMFVGAEIESTFGYEKVGKKHVITQMGMLLPMGDVAATYDYFKLEDGRVMLKTATMTTPFAAEPIVMNFHSYKLDGKSVPETLPQDAPAVTPKTDSGTETDGATPPETDKPVETDEPVPEKTGDE